MGFADQKTAAAMRDLIEHVTKGVVDRHRPDVRLAKVYDFDVSSGIAQVLFAGDQAPDTVVVKFGPELVPSVKMIDQYNTLGNDAPGDIVRIAGSLGNLFITGFVAGKPKNTVYDSVVPIGGIIDWPVITAPPLDAMDVGETMPRYVAANGQTLNISDYPLLFAAYGTSYGGDGVTTFGVPSLDGNLPSIIDSAAVTPLAGWQLDTGQIQVSGQVAAIQINGSRTGADITSSATGDIANQQIASVSNSLYWPRIQTALSPGSAGRLSSGYMSSADGAIWLSAILPNVNMTTGTGFSLQATYLINRTSATTNKIIRAR